MSLCGTRHETTDRGHQSCPVVGFNLEPQHTRPRGVLDISRTQLMSVDDEWNQAALGILPDSFRQIERSDQSGLIELGCNDGWALLEDVSDVDVLGSNRRHAVPRMREGLSVSLIPHPRGSTSSTSDCVSRSAGSRDAVMRLNPNGEDISKRRRKNIRQTGL
jgi:hypothetical protein